MKTCLNPRKSPYCYGTSEADPNDWEITSEGEICPACRVIELLVELEGPEEEEIGNVG